MLTKLDLMCLWSIADDYEKIPEIRLDLKNNASTEVKTGDIATSLSNLIAFGFAQAYRYDKAKQDYVPTKFGRDQAIIPTAALTWLPGQDTTSRLWFYITSDGKYKLKDSTVPWTNQ